MSEIWKDIPGFEGKYQVSDLGRVKSLKRLTGNGKGYYQPEIIKSQHTDPDGYRCVSFSVGNRNRKTFRVHRLVASVFIEPSEGLEVCHIDGNKNNNAANNLYYGNNQSNVLDRYKQGRTIFSIEEIKKIRDLASTISQKEIAALFKTSSGNISRIVNRKRAVYI